MSEPVRIRVATHGDGSQTMVTEWFNLDGTLYAEVATRSDKWATWGPPTELRQVDG